MAALVQQLEQLKKQQEELEKRIQKEAETKKKLNKDASIERLEALVEPITEYLDTEGKVEGNGIAVADWMPPPVISTMRQKLKSIIAEDTLQEEEFKFVERTITPGQFVSAEDPTGLLWIKEEADDYTVLEREEIYVTLIGILKNQEKRIEYLESIIIKYR